MFVGWAGRPACVTIRVRKGWPPMRQSEDWSSFHQTVESWLESIAKGAGDSRRAIVVELDGEGGRSWRLGGEDSQSKQGKELPPLLLVRGSAARVREAIGKYKLVQDFVVASGISVQGDLRFISSAAAVVMRRLVEAKREEPWR